MPDGCGGLCDLCMPDYYCPEGTAGLPPGSGIGIYAQTLWLNQVPCAPAQLLSSSAALHIL